MRRRAFIATYGAAIIASPRLAAGQARVPNLVYLWFGAEGSENYTREGLKAGLRELGYNEGRDIIIDYQYANGSEERLNRLVAEAVATRPDVILSPGGVVTAAVKQATATIPVVASTDLLAGGFAVSLARPGGNITGFTITAGAEIAQKWLELVHEIAPSARRIAYLRVESDPGGVAFLTMMREAAPLLDPHLTLSDYRVTRAADFPAAFEAVISGRADALIADATVLTVSNRAAIIAFAAEHRLPAVYAVRDFVDAGGLVSYGASIFDIWRRVAYYVDKILKGARPADLPVQQPTRFELVVNIRTAKALGIAIPQSILARADEVIE
jgi:putative ABC transport system substrate-binding protein